MKTLLIEVPADHGTLYYFDEKIIDFMPIENAVEAVEVKSTDKMIRQPSNARLEINGNSVTLYAAKREEV